MPAHSVPAVASAEPSRVGIVLFDGTCAFCEASVTFVAKRDPQKYFRFGASATPSARALLEPMGISQETARSIVLIEDGRAYFRSTAALRIARHMTFPWSLARVFLAVPRPLRDAVYNVVAAVRHRVAGRTDVCAIPPPEIRERLI